MKHLFRSRVQIFHVIAVNVYRSIQKQLAEKIRLYISLLKHKQFHHSSKWPRSAQDIEQNPNVNYEYIKLFCCIKSSFTELY